MRCTDIQTIHHRSLIIIKFEIIIVELLHNKQKMLKLLPFFAANWYKSIYLEYERGAINVNGYLNYMLISVKS